MADRMKLGRIDTSKPVCVGIGWNYLGVSVSKGVSPKQIAIVDYLCLATEPYLDDPMKVELGVRLGLTTYVCGIDNEGTECVAFGYTPVT